MTKERPRRGRVVQVILGSAGQTQRVVGDDDAELVMGGAADVGKTSCALVEF